MANGASNILSNPAILITFIGIFIFAVIIDVADLFMEFIGMSMVAPYHPLMESIIKSSLSAIDFLATLIIGGWSFYILKQGVPSKEGGGTLKAGKKRLEKGGKKIAGQATKNIGGKVVRRVGLGLIGELVPFVGAAPFWTLTVIYSFISVIRGK